MSSLFITEARLGAALPFLSMATSDIFKIIQYLCFLLNECVQNRQRGDHSKDGVEF